MARFFIDRPVFAWVIAIITMLAGVAAVRSLPVSQYPDIAPTMVNINATYPGASAKTLEESVTQVIEQQMTGLDGLDYMSSTSSSSGNASITLTFVTGTDPDVAQVQVQNKLSLATPLLPESVQRQGVTVNKAATDMLLITGIYSKTGANDRIDIADYIKTHMYDTISRLDGVGSVRVFGSGYAIRIWLDPQKLREFNLMPSDIVSVLSAQNTQVSSGNLGGTPHVPGQEINVTVTLQSLLTTPQEFRDLPVLTTEGGGTIRLQDVARVELGAEDYSQIGKFNGKAASGFGVNLATGANALATAERVKAAVAELAKEFPPDFGYAFPVDSTPFIDQSIHEVQKTLLEAILLVFVVIFIFLQSLRASFVPMIAVPVVLLGTFVVLWVMGMSINTLTMFGLVLAIGLLVDDAIVVVENVERVMREDKLGPLEATRKSMDQITGALVGIAVVLSAVFIPMAFFPGSAGVIYRQFSVTIVSAMLLSVAVAIILSPALCATILKSHHDEEEGGISGKLKRGFNNSFEAMTNGYASVVDRMVRRKYIFMGVFALMCGLLAVMFVRLPTSFLPQEDQGRVMVLYQLPQTATIERTETVMDDVTKYFVEEEAGVSNGIFTLAGFSFVGQGQNVGMAFSSLVDWAERDEHTDSAAAVAGRVMQKFGGRTDARIFSIVPAAIQGLGNSDGFDLFLQNNGTLTHEEFLAARNQFLGMAAQNPLLTSVRPNGQEDGPQFKINLDYQKAQALGISTSDATSVLSAALGGRYVNDFLDRGRIKRVYVQGDAPFRMQPEDVGDWFVRNNTGAMTPISEITTTNWTFGSPQLRRYNGLSAFNIQGSAAAGVSSGEAMNAVEDLIAGLPEGITYEWSGVSAQEKKSGNQSGMLYVISILFVFLCLAALYESWTVPVAVILVAPLGIIGAVLAAHSRGLANDVFFQVGLLTTVGLASKNAILIVEFAKGLEEQGKGLVEATIEAVRMRLRPILMTSFAFGMGVIPLALSHGAGAAGRISVGTIVLGGVIASTIFGIFFAPVFYVAVRKITGGRPLKPVGSQKEAV